MRTESKNEAQPEKNSPRPTGSGAPPDPFNIITEVSPVLFWPSAFGQALLAKRRTGGRSFARSQSERMGLKFRARPNCGILAGKMAHRHPSPVLPEIIGGMIVCAN